MGSSNLLSGARRISTGDPQGMTLLHLFHRAFWRSAVEAVTDREERRAVHDGESHGAEPLLVMAP